MNLLSSEIITEELIETTQNDLVKETENTMPIFWEIMLSFFIVGIIIVCLFTKKKK